MSTITASLGDFQDKNGNGIKEDGEPYIDKPEVAEYFSNTDNALLISYARQVHSMVAVGGNLKLLNQSIFQNSGKGFGIDIGLIAEPYKGLRVGAMLLDATGTQVRWDTADKPTFTRTRRLRFGTAYHFAVPRLGKGAIGADFETDQADLEDGRRWRRACPTRRCGILALQYPRTPWWLEWTWALCRGRTPLTDKCHVVFCQLRLQYPHPWWLTTNLCLRGILTTTQVTRKNIDIQSSFCLNVVRISSYIGLTQLTRFCAVFGS